MWILKIFRIFIRIFRKEEKEVITVKTEVAKEKIVKFLSALSELEKRIRENGEMFFRFGLGETDIATKLVLRDLIAEGNIEEIREGEFPIGR